jgi:hypothetical protein
MDKIQEIYKKYNRPGAQKLFQLAKNEGLNITLKQVQEFLGGRSEEQQLKETKKKLSRNKKSQIFNK